MQKYIEDKNGKKYTAKQMRLRVVRELVFVLKNSKRLKVLMDNTYVRPIGVTQLINFDSLKNQNKELEPLLKHCEVCALGGLFLADLIVRDQYKVGEEESGYRGTFGRWRMRNRLSPYFSDSQLDLIESTFEEHCSCAPVHGTYGHRESVKTCTMNFAPGTRDEKRLLAILQNIKNNDGTFRPFAARR